jgi:glycerol-3-phosphate O-acyltransferase
MTQRNAEALKVVGEIETLRTLFKDHTVVLVCTHSSNLDSLLIGYTMDLVGGVPAFSYGAGLNLFDSEFFAYFMNRLGAYKIDRRKKNVMYLQTLNSYSKLSILEEVNTIFFPGGTRSRSGEVEQKLKLGLLNSLLLAQRILIENKSNHKIIVFPVVLSYESVLEARSLIFQHLRGEGQEKFTTRERASSLGQYFKFIHRLIFQGSKIYLSIGQPLDVFGNRVNPLGESIDHKGKPLDLKSYFLRNGEMITDSQRESIYTRELSEKIATEYKYSNYILPCHVAAYAAFKILAKTNPSLDVYGLVQLPEEEYVFPKKAFYALFEEIRGILFHLAEIHKLIYPDTLEGELHRVAESGIQQLGIYHIKRVLNIDSFDRLISEDFLALMYYANKLNNLQIGELINWDKIPLDQEELR